MLVDGFVEVVVVLDSSSGLSTLMLDTGRRLGPSPNLWGTGLIVYHLFHSLTAMNAHK